MPLHPDVTRFLEGIHDPQATPLETLPVPEIRRRLAETPAPGPELARVQDVQLGGLRARLYCATVRVPVPVVALFHGGGWVAGSVDSHDATFRILAEELGDVAVVSVEYRQPPEHPFPAAADDARAAVSWLAREGASLGLAPERLGVAGNSAGGNLAAVACQSARDRVRAQVLHCPVLDCDFDRPSYREFAEGYLVTRGSLQWFWGQYVPDLARRADPAVSPLRAVDLRGLPPTLVQTAECDPLRDEAEAYARRLQEAGVAAALTRYEGHVHDPWFNFAVQPGGRASLREAARFLGGHLRP